MKICWKKILLILMVLFLIGANGLAFAAEENGEEVLPVQGKIMLTGDTFWYDMEKMLAYLEGNAVLTYEDVVVRAQEIVYSLETGLIEAEGNVFLEKGENQFRGPSLTYELKAGHGEMVEVKSRFTSDRVNGYIYSSSHQVVLEGENVIMEKSNFTTCDLEKPHYLLKTSKIVIIPGEYLIMHHVSFWELGGRLPLFYWPKLTIPLKDDEDPTTFTPKIGYSHSRGLFIKTTYGYYGEEDRGLIYLDYYTKTGFGGGVKHYYADEEDREGYIYLYGQEDRIGLNTFPQYEIELGHSQKWDRWGGELLTAFYHPFSGANNGEIDLGLRYKGEQKNLELNLAGDWEEVLEGQDEIVLSADADYHHRFTREWFLTADLVSEYLPEDDKKRLDGDLSLNYRGDVIDFGLNLERSAPKTVSGEDMKFARIPELELTVYPWKITDTFQNQLRPFTLNLTGGYYIERDTDLSLWKGEAEVEYKRYFRLINGLSLNVDQSFAFAAYAEKPFDRYGYNRMFYDGSLRFNYIIGPSLYTNLNYNLQLKEGESPFYFDRKNESHNLKADLNYNFSTGYFDGRYRLSSGYDFETKAMNNLNNYLYFNIGENLDLSLAASYNPRVAKWEKLYTTWKYSSTDVEWKSGLGLDPESLNPAKWDNYLSMQVGTLELQLIAGYDFTQDKFSRGEALLKWDLHCRTLSFKYDHLNREYWVNYQIDAFPGQSIGLGTSEDEELLFNIELGDLLEEEN